jgi:hypothetical protein
MQIALSGGTPDVVPTFLCYHGMYLNRHTTLDYLGEYLRRMSDRDQYPVDATEDTEIRRGAIQRTIDLFAGRVDHQFGFPSVRPIECQTMTRRYIEVVTRYVDAESVRVFDRGAGPEVSGITPHGNWDRSAVLNTEADVDRYFEPPPPAAPPKDTGKPQVDPYADLRAAHRNAITDSFRVGGFTSSFVSAIGAMSYQGAMLALHDKPKVLAHFVRRATEERLRCIRSADTVDGFWFDDYYTDVISPAQYLEYVHKPNLELAKAVREKGKLCMYYFCGDILAKLDLALELEVDAIAFEESKKWFRIDVGEVRRRVGNRKAVMGNMDGLHLLPRGSKDQIVDEVKRQLSVAARDGGFVMGAGSPIAPDTSAENMLAFLDATRRFGRYPMG